MSDEKTTQLAESKSRLVSVQNLLNAEETRKKFAASLPKHLTPDRFARIALTTILKNPKLAECSQASLFGCLLTLSQYGIEPDGRNAHLIPFGKDVQLIIDYKGLVELVMRSGQVKRIHADKVCENDDFVFNHGRVERHVIDFRNPRGKPYAYYVSVTLVSGEEKAECLSREEVDAIRERSKSKNNGPWVTDYDEMAKGKVFRRLSKWLTLSPELRDAINSDDDFVPTERNVTPAKVTVEMEPLTLEGGDA